MKKVHTIVYIVFWGLYVITSAVIAQEKTSAIAGEQLESLADSDPAEAGDDLWLQQMSQFETNPLNLNAAGWEELQELKIITDLQIASLLSYRQLLGKLISIYELQAVPGWDLYTIKKVLPFVAVGDPLNAYENFGKRIRSGNHILLLRISQLLEKAEGYRPDSTGNYYTGHPQKLFFRYRYQYKNLLQYGLVGDKDAGEPFLEGKQKYGFDFYSFHLYIAHIGAIQALAIGDFTISMGQGLIQWQSLAFRKGIDISAIKRQSPILRPYHSAGEYNFHRGFGITLRQGHLEMTAFLSVRNLSSNQVKDSLYPDIYFSSFLISGSHRTKSELENRNNLRQTSLGGNLSWNSHNFHLGINGIRFNFSLPLQKANEPYNLFAMSGKDWTNYSIDYGYTHRNFHFFGEAALDKYYNKAVINGLMISVDPRVDLSFLYRSISKKYQSLNGNAFTENSHPGNETGFYSGFSIRPHELFRIDAYIDIYQFPWLRYQVDGPSRGRDFFAQLTYSPAKRVQVTTRYHTESRQMNHLDDHGVSNSLTDKPSQHWRMQVNCDLNRDINIRSRFEIIWYDKRRRTGENGFLEYVDILYKPLLKPYSVTMRLQYFETDSYDSRLYAYENDVLYSYSIPVFFGKGFRYYLNLSHDINRHISMWFKWSQSIGSGMDSSGSGLDEIQGKFKTEVRLQFAVYL